MFAHSYSKVFRVLSRRHNCNVRINFSSLPSSIIAGSEHCDDGQVPGRGVLVVRDGRDRILEHEPGEPDGPDGGDLSPGDQVHVPQVRSDWLNSEARRALRAGPEHPEREDLRLPLVLVHPAGHALRPGHRLLGRRHPDAQHPRDDPQAPLPLRLAEQRRHAHQTDAGTI